ncbi:MAG: hypothetical protein ACJA0V_003554 [Planctomycetota bacterium]|jgi:hypothetical protein
MSYFRPEHTPFATEDSCVVEDIEQNVEVADGVVVERRSVLWLSVAAVTSMLVGSGSLRGQNLGGQNLGSQKLGTQDPGSQDPAPKQNPKLSIADFLNQLLPQARRLIDSKGDDEEAYLLTVAAAMSRLQDPNAPMREAMRQFQKENRKEGERFPIGAMAMSLKAGKGFTHHDHLNYNGVIMGLEGEARIRNYDFQGEPPANDSTKTFQIRETRDDLILPGRFSSLGLKRENIHDLVAGKHGARVLDVFTFFAGNATSRYLQVEDKPRDPEARIYDATWKQRRRNR